MGPGVEFRISGRERVKRPRRCIREAHLDTRAGASVRVAAVHGVAGSCRNCEGLTRPA